MKTKSIVLTLGLCVVATAICYASPHMGTWKLNESKSNFAPGSGKNHTVVYAAAGDSIKVTVDGTDGDGKPAHNDWTGKFDGKDYPITGDPTADMRSYKQVGDRTLELTNKKNGKVVVTGKVTVDGTDGDGKPAHNDWTGKFDGKDYPITGDPTADMRSYKQVGDRTLELTNKKNGKVVVTGKVIVSADGKTRTVTTSGTNAKGDKVENTAVYDKQ